MGKYSFRILFILLITNLLCINIKAQETLTLTLDQALEIALSESNTIKIADKTVEKSGYAQKGSYSALYPNVPF